MADTGEPSATARWVPVLEIGGEATLLQRARNAALYRRLRDGDGTGDFKSSGLAGFVYEVPIERLRFSPKGDSFSFRLEETDECFTRLLHVISDHFDTKCDADDEVTRLRARVAELEAQLDNAWERSR